MKHVLYFTIDDYYDEYHIKEYEYEYIVDIGLEDVKEYYYEKKFNKPFDEMSYRLDAECKEFVKDIEEKWLKNKVDELALILDYKFINWLKEKYYPLALREAAKNVIEEEIDEEIDAMCSCLNAYEYGYIRP